MWQTCVLLKFQLWLNAWLNSIKHVFVQNFGFLARLWLIQLYFIVQPVVCVYLATVYHQNGRMSGNPKLINFQKRKVHIWDYQFNVGWMLHGIFNFCRKFFNRLSAVDLQTQPPLQNEQQDSEGGCMCWKYSHYTCKCLLVFYFRQMIWFSYIHVSVGSVKQCHGNLCMQNVIAMCFTWFSSRINYGTLWTIIILIYHFLNIEFMTFFYILI